ncbi:MAG: histidine phosphatase family protein [Nanoarchaeota archaeon]
MAKKEDVRGSNGVTRLIFVRHGETEENKAKISQGQQPGKLSEEGIAQAKKVAARLKDEKIDFIYSSDLDRCRHTTQEVIKYHKAPVEYTTEARERSIGVFEGRPKGQFQEAEMRLPDYKPEKGESLNELHERARKFIEGILKKHRGKTILISSHGGLVRMAMANLLGMTINDAMDIKLGNTAVSVIEVSSDGRAKAVCLNCMKHL